MKIRFNIGDILYGTLTDFKEVTCDHCGHVYVKNQFQRPEKFECNRIVIYSDHIEYGHESIITTEHRNFADYPTNRSVFKTLKECQRKCDKENKE